VIKRLSAGTCGLSAGTCGRDRISPSKGLDAEFPAASVVGGLFEYFSPSYVEARKVGGKMVNTKRPLLYNYVFVHASEDEIFRLKRTLPLYNFLPRVSSGKGPEVIRTRSPFNKRPLSGTYTGSSLE